LFFAGLLASRLSPKRAIHPITKSMWFGLFRKTSPRFLPFSRIEKKVWPKFFQKILDGDKTFELRLADFECKLGDILVLREWDSEIKEYTGRVLEKVA